MRLVWAQLIFAYILLSAVGTIPSLSFFSDIETSDANVLAATALDGELSGDSLEGQLCDAGSVLSTDILIDNAGDLMFSYKLTAEDVAGPLCPDLEVTVSASTTEYYNGPLTGLFVDNLELDSGESTTLELTASLPGGSAVNGSCTFDTLLTASQIFAANDSSFLTLIPTAYANGFSDVERTSHTISRDTTSCGPTTLLYLNKHISGADQGFELSDFNYRIVGDGIDIIAAHDSFTPLPVGVYTIEELVPEGFVKEDWRIGWYGQCERSDTFITTIFIEERDIERSPLYCEADNQYRPGHGDRYENDEEAATQESNRSNEDGRDPRVPRSGRGGGGGSVAGTTTTITTATSSEPIEAETETSASTEELSESEETVDELTEDEEEIEVGEEEEIEEIDEEVPAGDEISPDEVEEIEKQTIEEDKEEIVEAEAYEVEVEEEGSAPEPAATPSDSESEPEA